MEPSNLIDLFFLISFDGTHFSEAAHHLVATEKENCFHRFDISFEESVNALVRETKLEG